MPIRFLAAAILLLSISTRPSAAAEGQLDADVRLFTVMAALNATGYDAGLHTCVKQPLRMQIRQYLANRKIPSLPELKRFIEARRKRTPEAEFRQYVSFALTVNGPPDFAYRVQRDEIPPDVLPLDGFAPLLARFYEEAGIEQLWRASQPAIEQALALYQGGVIDALLQVNGYLRNPTSGYLGRHFQIFVDLLGEPNQTQSRSYSDDYFVVVTASQDPQIEYIRHGYLHYLLDPLATKYKDNWDKKRGLGDYAQGAPTLELSYKEDFLLLATESLIRTVEVRLGPVAGRDAAIDQAAKEGLVLAPYFSDALRLYEKDQRSMRLYYADMVDALDARKEAPRLSQIAFVETRPIHKPKGCPDEKPAEPTGALKTLLEGERLSRAKQWEAAKDTFRRALQETDEKWLHARSYYGLARIAAIEKDPELAEKLFQKVLELKPEPEIESWCYVYLARLTATQVDADAKEIARLYRAALNVDGAAPDAMKAAQAGLEEASKKK